MNVVTLEQAKDQGLTSGQIWACAQWNYKRAGEVDNVHDEHRHMLQANALERIARKLEKAGM